MSAKSLWRGLAVIEKVATAYYASSDKVIERVIAPLG